mmetsp:Transcript_5395/g.14483  ORF Transcript_5395/g.14483 Transcript_5395/m.14483 type:complete len:143 (-) Transcript_5395:1639-2067(-)|eukprot:CAMPEP_0185830834 /NCGR_PEP_ID=MMETSP1353-20130828/1110_1 /TAXON_ID=1077150 /ORGANISM="Erythrolobus australicus, Strain CCMP3124" /LENGTH=142 /DNA_ID=CAMNT_0028528819 /DNA_START=51 /DNA_END=479 /DNA_ORIENTATION=-
MGGFELKGKLNVKIPEARGLPDDTDAYLRVYVVEDKLIGSEDRLAIKCKAEKNTGNPKWGLDETKGLRGDDYLSIKVVVKNKSWGPDKQIGSVEFSCEELMNQKTISGTYPLDQGGEIDITLEYEPGSAGLFGEFESTSDSD